MFICKVPPSPAFSVLQRPIRVSRVLSSARCVLCFVVVLRWGFIQVLPWSCLPFRRLVLSSHRHPRWLPLPKQYTLPSGRCRLVCSCALCTVHWQSLAMLSKYLRAQKCLLCHWIPVSVQWRLTVQRTVLLRLTKWTSVQPLACAFVFLGSCTFVVPVPCTEGWLKRNAFEVVRVLMLAVV